MKQSKELNTVRHTTELDPELLSNVRNSIIVIRGKPVIADADVANLYGVETKRINEAVRNNPDKFPENYMFILSSEQLKNPAISSNVHCNPQSFSNCSLSISFFGLPFGLPVGFLAI